MYKKIVLLLTFIVSFIVSINVVSAAQELTCTYDTGGSQDELKITQESNGKISIYYDGKDRTDDVLDKLRNSNANGTNTGYNSSTNSFTSCPPCANALIKTLDFWRKIEFKNYESNGKCYSSFQPQKKSSDTNWKKICHYKLNGRPEIGVILYYNETNYDLVYSNSSNYILANRHYFTVGQIWNNNSNHNCPATLYSEFITGSETEQGSVEIFNLDKKGVRIYTNTSEDHIEQPGETTVYPDPDNCRELFGDEVIEIINKVMSIIRIIVPVLLLVFGTTDFFTAIFSSSEDNMKEHRNRFFKRIAAALIVFIVPVFVNLVLKLANSVWSDIHDETCVENN